MPEADFKLIGWLVGHVPVSTHDRAPNLWIDALARHGVPLDSIYQDQASGASVERAGS